LPKTELPVAEAFPSNPICTPTPLLPEITLPSPAIVPPTAFDDESLIQTPVALGIAFRPFAVVPM